MISVAGLLASTTANMLPSCSRTWSQYRELAMRYGGVHRNDGLASRSVECDRMLSVGTGQVSLVLIHVPKDSLPPLVMSSPSGIHLRCMPRSTTGDRPTLSVIARERWYRDMHAKSRRSSSLFIIVWISSVGYLMQSLRSQARCMTRTDYNIRLSF